MPTPTVLHNTNARGASEKKPSTMGSSDRDREWTFLPNCVWMGYISAAAKPRAIAHQGSGKIPEGSGRSRTGKVRSAPETAMAAVSIQMRVSARERAPPRLAFKEWSTPSNRGPRVSGPGLPGPRDIPPSYTRPGQTGPGTTGRGHDHVAPDQVTPDHGVSRTPPSLAAPVQVLLFQSPPLQARRGLGATGRRGPRLERWRLERQHLDRCRERRRRPGHAVVRGHLVGRDLVRGHLVGRDLVRGHLVGRDLVGRDLVGRDLVGRDLVGRDLVGRHLVRRDVVVTPSGGTWSGLSGSGVAWWDVAWSGKPRSGDAWSSVGWG